MLSVGFILLHQFTLAAFAGLLDVLRLAADHGGRSRQIHTRWRVMSMDGLPRTSSAGATLSVDSALPDDPAQFAQFDYIAVCGGNDYPNTYLAPPLRDWLREASAHHVRMLGICTGTFVLAQAGLIGKRAVCIHWNVLDAFRARYPEARAVVDHLFVDEGDVITCAGSTAAIDLGLYLVTRHCGRAEAQQVVRHMMLQGIRPAKLPQAHFYADLTQIKDIRVRQAAHFIEQRIDNPPTLDAIARYVGVGRRQLERAFREALGVSPMAFLRSLRLEYGRWLLLNNPSGITQITQIALDCGFADGAHFSRDFRAKFGVSPREFQREAGGQAQGDDS
ncbi:GlxA family transcriptional regulator [Paraburkholderia hayleyella]|uniref:GlxA family transcriptional regulator n=1 Tax=Paraburkholderia hayleyella TaxID=2152889 RepID=UPI001FEAACDA|nr:GlxA family transcriptional regulator [Paraburkholderia hayleyella]